VIATVDQRHFQVDHREAGEHAGAQHRLQTLLDARDVFLRHCAADHLVLEHEAGADFGRLSHDLDLGELHLDIKVDILKRTYKVEANIGAPQVAYREKITRPVTKDYTHKKQTGGTGQYARVKIVLEPLPPGTGFEFDSKVVGGNVPKEYIPGVEKGIESVLGSGVLAGFPVVDLKVSLIDGGYHEVDSSALAFEIASRSAMREGLREGGPVLLEPIMKVEVVTPEDYTGSVIGDLNSRRGQIQGQDMRGNANVVTAMVPLQNMFGYVSNLRSMSQGRATFTMQFDHYAEVPRAVAEEIQAKFA
jgi:elongation factor G